MHNMCKRITLAVLAVFTVGCCTSVDRNVAEHELMNADRAFAADSEKYGLDGWMDWFAPDAVIFPPDSVAVRGTDDMRIYYEEIRFDPTRLNWEPSGADVSDDGTVGMTWGTWRYMIVDPDGVEKASSGKYLTAWHRQGDGAWRVTADMGIMDAQ